MTTELSRSQLFKLFGLEPSPEVYEGHEAASERELITVAAYAQGETVPPLHVGRASSPQEPQMEPCPRCEEPCAWVRLQSGRWSLKSMVRCQPARQGSGFQVAWSEKNKVWFAVRTSIRADRIVSEGRWAVHRCR
ncbi:hypothetical protein [Candidatus Nephthysia bennettiae]|uniref:Uncharacterized protein n=1 Tax=Candidatus Nephthysia bennettiae TaxID=3127016 RepID=A0A934K4B3_9BACT|nr:hypothetical protein [Candidatus Dormibacteraeota bacterium]